MKRPITMAIWVVALAAVLVAAYTFYNKNKPQFAYPPDVQSATAQGQSGETAAEGSAPAGDTGTDAVAGNGTDLGKTAAEGGSTEGTAGESTTTESAAGQDKIMAPDFALKGLDGNTVKLSDYRGKIVILNFWAVWCKYCKQEMPDLNQLDQELKEKKDAVILAVDVQESKDVVSKYLTSDKITLKVLLDEDGSTAATYGIEGYPTTFIINADGSLYTYIPHATDLETLQKVLDMARNGEPLQ